MKRNKVHSVALLDYPKNWHNFESSLSTSLSKPKGAIIIRITNIQDHQLRKTILIQKLAALSLFDHHHNADLKHIFKAANKAHPARRALHQPRDENPVSSLIPRLFRPYVPPHQISSQKIYKNINERIMSQVTLTLSSTTPNTSRLSSLPSPTSSTKSFCSTTSLRRPLLLEVHPTRALWMKFPMKTARRFCIARCSCAHT